MKAYEFNSVIHEGMIHIPEQYKDKLPLSVRVIIYPNTFVSGVDNRKKFTAMKLKTKNFVFNRDEANERNRRFLPEALHGNAE
ncbi:MAG: hypothetical protein LBK18_06015 [Prevotellaceae bacterium]|jgi:hypothetical protein|nr:hypothetical protein [Prevotellaceae bacterium]